MASNRKVVAWRVLIVVSGLVLVGAALASTQYTGSEREMDLPMTVSYSTHEPIIISSDSDFTHDNGVTVGSGTPSDPYIIEGWQISASTTAAISISDTECNVVIRGVLLEAGGTSNDGVQLVNVANVRIEESSVHECRYGVHIDGSTMVDVSNSAIDSCDVNGIYVVDSDNCTTLRNAVSGTTGSALTNCGILAYMSDNITIAHNTVTSNSWDGIDVRMCTNVDVGFNNVSMSLETGLWYDSTNGGLVYGNQFYMNGGSGIVLWSAVDVTVEACNITLHSPYGIDLQGCERIHLFHNNLVGNSHNAVDQGGQDNVWDDGYPSGGNHWDDYSGPDVNLDGIGDEPHYFDADSSDPYPLMAPYTPETPSYRIFIDGDDEFLLENGVIGGSGSESDPYLISGLSLNASAGVGVYITNTRAHFILEDIQVASTTRSFQGVLLSNVTNGTVDECSVSNCTYGIEVFDSSEVVVTECSCALNTHNGIYLHESDNCTLSADNVTGTTGSSLTNCGIYVYSTQDATVADNYVSQNAWDGMDIRVCSRVTVTGNEIVTNSITGLWLDESDDCTLSNNNVLGNGGTGVVFWDVTDSEFAYNDVKSNGNYGIDLRSCNGVVLHHNSVVSQGDNAYDNSENNQWDDGCEGNYWGDYSGKDDDGDGIGDTSYAIGPYGQDRYPLMSEPVAIPEFSSAMLLVSICVILVIVLASARARRPPAGRDRSP